MREKVAAFVEAVGAGVWALVLLLRWLHATLIAPVGSFVADGLMPIYEESVKAFVREWFAVVSRNLNTASAFLLSLLSGHSYRRTAARHAEAKQQAWHRWWRSARGTFNALIEQEGLAGAGDGQNGGTGSSPSPSISPGASGGAFLEAPQPSGRLPMRRASSNGRDSSGSGGSSSGSGRGWRFWRRRSGSGNGLEEVPGTSSGRSDLRRGTVLFELPSGFAVVQMGSSRGLLEDLRVGSEVAVGRAFGAVRRLLHRLLWLDAGRGGDRESSPAELLARRMRRVSQQPPGMPRVEEEAEGRTADAAAGAALAATAAAAAGGRGAGASAPAAPAQPAPAALQRRSGRGGRPPPLKSLLRSGRHWEEDLSVWTASDVILREGYPLEQHSVTTQDGYVLQMHRIPRHGARDVAFFQHGVLDTSLGWVSNGVVGSAAFAAYDAGFDVWLGNSRSNAPRLHLDAEKQSSRYWRYSINEMGICDISAAITHIHNTKMAELAAPAGRHAATTHEGPSVAAPQLRRAATDSVLDALRWVDVHSGADLEQGAAGAAQQAQQQAQGQGEPGLSATASGLAAAAAAWAAAAMGTAASSSSSGGAEDSSNSGAQQQQQQQQQQLYWWQRWGWRHGTAQQPQELAQAPVGRGAASLRRCQSALDPLQHDSSQVGHVAVPMNTRSMRERAAQGSAQSGSGGGSGTGGSGSGAPAARASAGAGTTAAAGGHQEVLPYRLQAVGHSLGAATLLMYAVVCRMRGQPHRLRRLVLMSPAGFHPTVPLGLRWCTWAMPAAVWLLDRTPGLRGRGMGMRLPSPLLRYITFKFTMDLRHMPALQDLIRAFMRMMLSGDSSQWDAALQMPHYSTYSMPALSLHCGAHFAQWSNDLSFRLFDYGSAAANRRHYGSDRPPSLADNFRLLDVPVDLLAGAADGIIPPACVMMHAQRLRQAGVPCSFRILPAGHMDLTFAVRDDIRLFVLSKLRNPL
ncbi:hypothetical protein ABPG75_013383 [Micractinium tetrahymenae]